MKISVALCTYNGAKYIKEELESIFTQTIKIDEIIVCDDGSEDETLSIICQMSQLADIDIKIIKNSNNLGYRKNFEKAISLCDGDIIFLADQDDIWKLNKVQIVKDYFEENPSCNVVFSDADIIDGDGKEISSYSLLYASNLLQHIGLWNAGAKFEMLMLRNFSTGATMAIRKSYRSNIIPIESDNNSLLHDHQIAIKACADECLGVVFDKLIKYRIHGNNNCGLSWCPWFLEGKKSPNLMILFTSVIKIPEFLLTRNSSHIEFYKERYICTRSPFLYFKLLSFVSKYKFFYKSYWLWFLVCDCLYPFRRVMSKLTSFGNKKR